jgi:hypothetical protein
MGFRAWLRDHPLKAVASRLGAAFACAPPQAKDNIMPVTHPLLTQQQSLWSANVAATMASIDGSQRLARMQWELCQRWSSQTSQIVMDTIERSSAVFAEQAVALQRSLEAPVVQQAPVRVPVLPPVLPTVLAPALMPMQMPLFGATQSFFEIATNLSRAMRSV